MSARRPVKILHVVLSMEPGGLENGIVNVARGLDHKIFQVDVCCLERAGEFALRLPAGSKVHVLGKPPGFSLRAVYGLARIIRQTKPDVVHTHNLGNLIYSSIATAFGHTRPILHSEHGELPADERSPRRLRQRRWFYRSCRKVHVVSNGLRQRLIELRLAQDRICALLNGVDTNRFFPADRRIVREQLQLNPNGPVLGIVGRFIPTKRHEVLFAAFERLACRWPGAQLLVVGSGGPEAERMTRLAKASRYAGRIRLAGYQADPCPYYQAMDLLVSPSVIEGMSNVVLEAMACGLPTLSHTACGSGEMIQPGETGFLANLETPDLLFEKLIRVLAAPERMAAIGRNARAAAVSRFSLAKMAHQYESLYVEVARNRRISHSHEACEAYEGQWQ